MGLVPKPALLRLRLRVLAALQAPRNRGAMVLTHHAKPSPPLPRGGRCRSGFCGEPPRTKTPNIGVRGGGVVEIALINSKTITRLQQEPTVLRKPIDRTVFLASETGPSCRSQRTAGSSPESPMLHDARMAAYANTDAGLCLLRTARIT